MLILKNVHETISCHCVSYTIIRQVTINTPVALHVWQLWNRHDIVLLQHRHHHLKPHFIGLFFMYILPSVISFHCNIFVKLSIFYIYILQTVRKVSVSYLYSLMPTMRAMCYSKATKRDITHIEYWKKNMYGDHVLHCHSNKNIYHIDYWKKSMYNRRRNLSKLNKMFWAIT